MVYMGFRKEISVMRFDKRRDTTGNWEKIMSLN
jgi:hypothetical protein